MNRNSNVCFVVVFVFSSSSSQTSETQVNSVETLQGAKFSENIANKIFLISVHSDKGKDEETNELETV